MIKRIVKMTFQENKTDDFLAIFEENKGSIRKFDGCLHLELLQVRQQPTIFFTFSIWENEAALESYRQSELFKSTWARTKVLFSQKPEAWSVNVASEV